MDEFQGLLQRCRHGRSSAPVYPAGESPIEGVDSHGVLVKGLKARGPSLGGEIAGPGRTGRGAGRRRTVETAICRGAGDDDHPQSAAGDSLGDRRNCRSKRRMRAFVRRASTKYRRAQAPVRCARQARCPAPPAPLVWFKCGRRGRTGCSSRPTSRTCLTFLTYLARRVPVMALGLGSNLIVRDGGVPGVVVRLGKPFAQVETARRGDPALRRRGERHPGRPRPRATTGSRASNSCAAFRARSAASCG